MCRFVVFFGPLVLCVSSARAAAPLPTPTPSPRSLAQLAARVELDRSTLGDGGGPIVISNDNLGDLAAAGRLTTAPVVESTPAPAAQTRSPRDEAALRERWRTAYRRQQEQVITLEEQLARLDLDLAAALEAERSRPPGRARRPDRTPVLRQSREALAARLERERSELRRIVREARADGAKPGWFR
jgi:hypothetical protein